MRRFLWLALILFLLTACAPATETAVSPQPSPETAVLPNVTATVPPPVITEEIPQAIEATAVPDTPQPPAAPAATATEVVVETGVISGRTEEGAFFLGDPNAPITHIDYSDFL